MDVDIVPPSSEYLVCEGYNVTYYHDRTVGIAFMGVREEAPDLELTYGVNLTPTAALALVNGLSGALLEMMEWEDEEGE